MSAIDIINVTATGVNVLVPPSPIIPKAQEPIVNPVANPLTPNSADIPQMDPVASAAIQITNEVKQRNIYLASQEQGHYSFWKSMNDYARLMGNSYPPFVSAKLVTGIDPDTGNWIEGNEDAFKVPPPPFVPMMGVDSLTNPKWVIANRKPGVWEKSTFVGWGPMGPESKGDWQVITFG